MPASNITRLRVMAFAPLLVSRSLRNLHPQARQLLQWADSLVPHTGSPASGLQRWDTKRWSSDSNDSESKQRPKQTSLSAVEKQLREGLDRLAGESMI